MAKVKVKVEEKVEKKKTEVTSKQLDAAPSTIEVIVDGQKLLGEKKQFSSGSVGWNVNGKVIIGGLKSQVSANVIIIGSKNVK